MNIANFLNKFKGNKALVNGSLFSLYSFIGKGISFLILILLTNYISPEEYGYLNLFTTVVSFVTIFMALSTSGYVSISFFRKEEDDFKRDFTSIFLIGIITFVFFVLITLIGGDLLSTALQLSTKLLLIAVVISFFTFSYLLQQDILRVEERIKAFGVYNVSNSLLNLVLTFFFVIFLHQGWIGRVDAHLLCTIAFGLLSICFFFHRKLFKPQLSNKRFKSILLWGIPMIPHHATGWIRQGLDRYIINYYYTVSDVGIFSFALNIANVIQLIGMAFNATNSVSLFQTLSNKELSNDSKRLILRSQVRNIGAIYVVAVVIVVIVVTPLTYYILPQYRNAIPYIWIISICGFLKCIYFLYCNYLFYYSKTKNLMYITFGTSLLHVLMSFILTQFSLYLTAVVYVVVQTIITLLVYMQSQQLIRKKLCKT